MVGAVAVLPEEDALPGAQGAAAVGDGDTEGGLGEGGSDVRGHVVGALRCVNEERISIGDEARKESIEVTLDVGVGVLVDDQRSARVVHEDRAQTFYDAGFGDGILNATGDLDDASAWRFDGEREGPRTHDSVTLVHMAA